MKSSRNGQSPQGRIEELLNHDLITPEAEKKDLGKYALQLKDHYIKVLAKDSFDLTDDEEVVRIIMSANTKSSLRAFTQFVRSELVALRDRIETRQAAA